MRFHIIRTVFLKELREMLRDRRSLVVMFGVPLILYPLLTVGLGALTRTKTRELKEARYRIAVVNPGAAPELARRLADEKQGFEIAPLQQPWRALADGSIQAIVEIPAGLERDLLNGKEPAVTIRIDGSRTESGIVRNRINQILDAYQSWVIGERLRAYNVSDRILQGVGRTVVDVASSGQRMGNYLAQLLPLLVLITGMLGALFPALSATTTERELGTLETLLVTPAGRGELMIAKAALVLVCGVLTALLNVLSMSLVLWHTFSLADRSGGALSINFGSLGLMFLAALPALVFFTTCVLIVGLIARTYREANSYATPAMLLPIASLALTIADVPTTPGLLVTPIANTTLVMRDVLRGRGNLGEFLIAFSSSLVYAGLLMSLAARLFSNEQLVNPAWEPLSLKGLGKRQRRPRLPAIDEAIALFFVSLLLIFYVQPHLLGLGLYGMLAVTQVALVFAPAAAFALIGRWKWRETFKLCRPRGVGLAGAALLGIGLAGAMTLISQIFQRVWPGDPELQKAMNDLIVPTLRRHPILTPVIVGVLAGVFEELLFRGPIQSAIARRGRPWTAITVAALLFAAAHLDLRGLPLRMLLGIVLGWLVVRTGSIFPAMVAHGLYDAAALGLSALHLPPPDIEPPDPLTRPWVWVYFACGTVISLAGWRLIRRMPPGEPAVAGAALEHPSSLTFAPPGRGG